MTQASIITYYSHSFFEMFIGNAGTAMRPLAGVLCAGEGTFVLDGTPRMRERPIDDLVDGLLQVRFKYFYLLSVHFYL